MTAYHPEKAILELVHKLLNYGYEVKQKTWQSIDSPDNTFEILNQSFGIIIPQTIQEMQLKVKPNLPWADEHFEERVSGEPMNPPPSHKHWPFSRTDNAKFVEQEKFSHTYPERFWPRYAGKWKDVETYGFDSIEPNPGIRYGLGDLRDLVNLLGKDPTTRQAYLPVFFPEDTGCVHGKRIPCTLGYHFIIRGGYLHTNYYMRSCDILRHFQDDVYLAMRLAHWIIEELLSDHGITCHLGILNMHIVSLHCFKNDLPALRRKYGIEV